MRSRELNS